VAERVAEPLPVRGRGAARRIPQLNVPSAVRARGGPDLTLPGEEHAPGGGDLDAVDLQAGQQLIRLLHRVRATRARPGAGRRAWRALGLLAGDDARVGEPADDRGRERRGGGLGRLDVGDDLKRVPHGATIARVAFAWKQTIS